MLNLRRWVSGNLVLMAFIVAAGMGNASAAPESAKSPGAGQYGYRTGTLVPSDKNECAGVPDCLSATLPATGVPAHGEVVTRFACPNSHPNLWGWDAAQHEHIAVQMVDVDKWTVSVKGVNASNAPGDFIVSLGCSTQPYAGSGIQVSRQLAPTLEMGERRPTRTSRGHPDRHLGNQLGVDFCGKDPDCQAQPQPTFAMGGWASTTKSYQCKSPFPYAWGFTYSQTGSPSVSTIGALFAANPGTYDVLLTNWNPFATDDVTIILGCSTRNSFDGGTCGAPQADPGCPQVPGSTHMYCSRGPVPVCFATYQERCAPSNVLYSCTIDVIVPWCQPCPGQ